MFHFFLLSSREESQKWKSSDPRPSVYQRCHLEDHRHQATTREKVPQSTLQLNALISCRVSLDYVVHHLMKRHLKRRSLIGKFELSFCCIPSCAWLFVCVCLCVCVCVCVCRMPWVKYPKWHTLTFWREMLRVTSAFTPQMRPKPSVTPELSCRGSTAGNWKFCQVSILISTCIWRGRSIFACMLVSVFLVRKNNLFNTRVSF